MSDTLSAAIRTAAPAIAIDGEAHGLRAAIRLYCGPRAAALEAQLTVLLLNAEMAAMETADRSMRVSGAAQ